MAFRRDILRRHRWSGHLVEDAEFQMELLLSEGVIVRYVPEAHLEAEMPATLQHRVRPILSDKRNRDFTDWRRIDEICAGERAITADTAVRLGLAFGMEPQFWLNLQTQYDLEVIERDQGSQLAEAVQPIAA